MSGTTEVASTKVKKDAKITLPTDFEKYNLYSDSDCTKPFDTNTAITADTTIYVKIKTFTISYKVLPFDKVNPVEGETNGSMPAEYGKVFTDEEINAFAVEIDGHTYKGIFTDEACTSPFDNTNAITSDLTVYVLYEEVVEETNYSYVLENLNKEECSIPTTAEKKGGTFGLYYSDTGVAVNEGDKVYFQGTLTFNEALDAKQLYIQTNLNGWNNQAGQVWKNEGIDEGSYNFAVAYDVTAPESLTHVQIAIDSLLTVDGTEEGAVIENDDLKVTVKDFYVVHIAKENVEKVFPVVYSTTESPVVLNLKTGDDADGKTYETNINKNSVAFAAGDTIEFSIEIPEGADITGAQQVWMQTAADGWGWHSMLYSEDPYATTTDDLLGVLTATCSAAIDIDSINLNYGIQKKDADSSGSFSLPITKVTLRKIPKFTSNK